LFTFKPPPTFSGTVGKNFTDFIKKLNKHLTLQGVSNDNQNYKIAFLENNLTGAALASYRDIKYSANAPDTYDEII